MALKRRRGSFLDLSPERRREIAASGGRAAHALKHAHQWTSEEASLAGKKGVRVREAKRVRWAPETLEADLVAAYPELFK